MERGDILTLKDILGHKTIEMTLRYAHLSPNHKRRAVEILDKTMDSYMDSKPQNSKISEIAVFDNMFKDKGLAQMRP